MASESSKNIAFAAYITPVGWGVAMACKMLCSDHKPFTIFHLRQSLGLALFELLSWIIVMLQFDLWVLWQIMIVLFVVMTVFGINAVYKNRLSRFPLVGGFFYRLFSFIK